MTMILAGVTRTGKIVTVADTVVYRGLVFLGAYPIHKVRPINRRTVLGLAGGFFDVDETYDYFSAPEAGDLHYSFKRFREERRRDTSFAGTGPFIGGQSFMFGVAENGGANIFVSDNYEDLRRADICAIGVERIREDVLGILHDCRTQADAEYLREHLKRALETAKNMHNKRLPLRGCQTGILSYDRGFEELEFIF